MVGVDHRLPLIHGHAAQVAEGLRWLIRHRLLRVVAVLLGVFNFANQMGQAILVLLATQTLHVGSRGYGFLLAASAIGIFLIPVIFSLVEKLSGAKSPEPGMSPAMAQGD